jgi:putative transposase
VKKAKFAFIDSMRGEYPVAEMCRALGVTRQGYYAWAGRGESAHDGRDRELSRAISGVYEGSRRVYGAPKVFRVLGSQGVRTSRKRVARLMREMGIRGVTRACAKHPAGEKRVSRKDSPDDLVKRRFEADGPNRAWFADITYVRTHQGWLYLAVVMDVWSRMIVGWSMGPRITAELADDALKMAIARRRPEPGCIHHSDSKNVHSRFAAACWRPYPASRDRIAAS